MFFNEFFIMKNNKIVFNINNESFIIKINKIVFNIINESFNE